MPSLSNTAVSSMPSIQDNTLENKTWAPLQPQPKQLNSGTMKSTADSLKKDHDASADQHSSNAQQAAAKVAQKTWSCRPVSDYRPLDIFRATAEDPGSASWSEAEELCEVFIRMKEVELGNMIEESSGFPECKGRNIKYCRIQKTRRRQR